MLSKYLLCLSLKEGAILYNMEIAQLQIHENKVWILRLSTVNNLGISEVLWIFCCSFGYKWPLNIVTRYCTILCCSKYMIFLNTIQKLHRSILKGKKEKNHEKTGAVLLPNNTWPWWWPGCYNADLKLHWSNWSQPTPVISLPTELQKLFKCIDSGLTTTEEFKKICKQVCRLKSMFLELSLFMIYFLLIVKDYYFLVIVKDHVFGVN